MKIFRIENEDGIGPFSKPYFETTEHKDFYNNYFWPKIQEHYTSNHLPNLEEDGLESSGLSGCAKVSDFNFWFTKDILVALDAMNFTIACYETDDIHVKHGKSQRQIVFDKDQVEFYKEISIEKLYAKKIGSKLKL